MNIVTSAFCVFLIYITLTCMWFLKRFQPPPSLNQINEMFEGSALQVFSKIDCELEFVPCFENSDCNAPCINGENSYCVHKKSKLGSIGNCMTKITEIVKKPKTECKHENGLIEVVEDVDGILQISCMSLYPELINDEGEKHEWVCHGGTFNLHLEDIKSPLSCICNEMSSTIWFKNSPSIPRCVPKNSEKFLLNSIIIPKHGLEM